MKEYTTNVIMFVYRGQLFARSEVTGKIEWAYIGAFNRSKVVVYPNELEIAFQKQQK